MSNNVTKDELKIALREHKDEIVGVMQSLYIKLMNGLIVLRQGKMNLKRNSIG